MNRHAGVIAGVTTGAAVFAVALAYFQISADWNRPKAVPPGETTLFVLSSDAWMPMEIKTVTNRKGRLAGVRIGSRRYKIASLRQGLVLAQTLPRSLAGISARPVIRLRGSRDFDGTGGVLTLVLTRDATARPSDDRLLRLAVRSEDGRWKAAISEGEPAPFEQLHIGALRAVDAEPGSLRSDTGSGQARGAKLVTVVQYGQPLAHFNTVHLERD